MTHKLVNIFNVKVICGDDTSQAMIAAAIKDIRNVHNNKKTAKAPGFRGSVINMSFGSRKGASVLAEQIREAYRDGIFITAPAGNDNRNMPGTSEYPCCFLGVFCVAATNPDYGKVESSNYGRCVDYIASGQRIYGADFHQPNDGETALTGTSEACPQAAGVAAIFIWVCIGPASANRACLTTHSGEDLPMVQHRAYFISILAPTK